MNAFTRKLPRDNKPFISLPCGSLSLPVLKS